ncbi:tetratricopeptide repeat protein [Mucilaginibacter sp. HMF7410]|uniref:Tetratricopeptide repeat protein n=1 Tax=Mucilaginibacter arboris TaxID=2682090 RepID=A0A7K1SZ90_9SPHI|nr:tetratricopeptide repeat protein [Mucilaginibacter arboris]
MMLLLPMFSLGDNKENVLFEKGNQLYAKAQYQQAAQTYQQILNDGYQSAVIYFNTGNAYYKLDDMASAILYYEKARKLAPNDKDININIQFANLKIADKIEPQPDFFVARWWHNFILVLPANILSIISDLLFLGGFLLLIAYLFAGSLILKKASFFTGIVAILFGIITIFMANRQINYFNSHHQAIIFSNSVIVKGSPDVNAKPLFVMHEGTKVDVNQKNGNWIEIELPNGNSGWITVDNVKDI